MAQTILIKRSTSNAAPSSALTAGELAYSFKSDSQKLFIGDGSNNLVIGGKVYVDMLDHTAGTLTASSAITTDASSKVNKLLSGVIQINNTANQIDTTSGNLILNPNSNLVIETGTVDVSSSPTEIKIKDGSATALTINEQSNNYITLDSTNAAEKIKLAKTVEIAGNYTLPTADGSNGHAILTNGSGVATFGAVATTLNVATSSGSGSIALLTDTISYTAGAGIDTSFSGTTVTIAAEIASSSNEGIASFDSTDFSVSGTGHVTVAATTLGTSALNPGASTLSIAGLQQLDVDNVRVDGNTVSTTNSNGDLVLSPNGTGTVTVPAGYKDRTGFSTNSLATKEYVDAIKQALDIKDSVKVATTANLGANYNNGGGTLTNSGADAALVIDGVTLAANDRVLVKNQTAELQNGIYTVTNIGSGSTDWILTRATDANTAAELSGGVFVFVEQGSLGGENGYVFTHNDNPTIGTTALPVTQFSGAGQVIDGDGIAKSGNTLSITADNKTIEVNSDAIRLKGVSATAVGDILLGVASDAGYARLVKPASAATAYTYLLSMDTSGNARWGSTLDGGSF